MTRYHSFVIDNGSLQEHVNRKDGGMIRKGDEQRIWERVNRGKEVDEIDHGK